MNDAAKKYLYDIEKSIDSVALHLRGINDFNQFSRNLTVKRAVEREFEIIGEAINQLKAVEPEIKIPDTRKIIAMRNRIIHGYDSVDDTIIWNVVIKDMPVLKCEIEKLMRG
ncbi:MAG: DUF86 domain-containing protein [Deltaproteobacteria bacterium]|nr:DUF86 domain-containing protein [Deltaproteobacteria bacterium]